MDDDIHNYSKNGIQMNFKIFLYSISVVQLDDVIHLSFVNGRQSD